MKENSDYVGKSQLLLMSMFWVVLIKVEGAVCDPVASLSPFPAALLGVSDSGGETAVGKGAGTGS